MEVPPGIYPEQIELKSGVWVVARVPGALELRSPADGDSSGPAVVARGVKGAGLSGIRVVAEPRKPNSVGMLIEDSQIVLDQIEVAATSEAGIAIRGMSVVRLHAADLHDNSGAAIFASGPAKLEVTDSRLFRNGNIQSGRAAIELGVDTKADLRGNVFGDNVKAVKAAGPNDVESELHRTNVVLDRTPAHGGK